MTPEQLVASRGLRREAWEAFGQLRLSPIIKLMIKEEEDERLTPSGPWTPFDVSDLDLLGCLHCALIPLRVSNFVFGGNKHWVTRRLIFSLSQDVF